MVKTVVLLIFLTFLASIQARCRRHQKSKRLTNIFPGGKIVGGEDTDITQIPYQVQLADEELYFCGGSILSASYVLTAAQCTYEEYPDICHSTLYIRYGTSNRDVGGTIVQVAEIAQHPQYEEDIYDSWKVDFDVSVLRLKNEIIFSDKAQPIALTSVEPTAGQDALVSGWGVLTWDDEEYPEQLQSVIVQVIDRETCNKAYDNHITEQMICGGVTGKDSCQGDSGGPFVTEGAQSGIASWGYGCACEVYPGVYANVAVLRDFIDQNSNNTARWV